MNTFITLKFKTRKIAIQLKTKRNEYYDERSEKSVSLSKKGKRKKEEWRRCTQIKISQREGKNDIDDKKIEDDDDVKTKKQETAQ